ncbi:MAG: polyprenyl synthetase family protein [Candidatus Bipolaricaulota bacterium]|nr:polyprenyl synthetase family protein [Candidatus Bipolaricaulota bacterium]
MDPLDRFREPVARLLGALVPEEGALRPLLGYPLGVVEVDGRPGPGPGGKLLRPSLVLFSCQALGGEAERALPLAVALELVHTFSLVHDDIQDGDELRRGRPTAWKAFGVGQAVNAGDALLVLALQAALRAELPLPAKLQAQEALLSATLRMVEGQALDLSAEGKPLDVPGYLDMARRKTGALLGAAFALGALAAGRPDLQRISQALGEELGLAFQIRDDLLGIWGDPQRTGKPVGGDLLRKKRSFPVSFALERDPALAPLLSAPEAHLAAILARLEAVGAQAAAQEEVERHLRAAEGLARELPWPGWARAVFGELLAFLATREA